MGTKKIGKNPAAVALGVLGGKARAERMKARGQPFFTNEQQALGGKRSGETKRARKAAKVLTEQQTPE